VARDLTNKDFQALAEFRYQIRRFLHFSEKAARAEGLNPQQHQLLLILKGLPKDVEPTVGEIAGRLFVRHHSAVELTERLTENRLLRKRHSTSDRRRVLLEITGAGEAILRKLSLIHRTQLKSLGADLIKALKNLQTYGSRSHAAKSSSIKKASKRIG
jgi:DNA-binding MarR family transcriptional regulator